MRIAANIILVALFVLFGGMIAIIGSLLCRWAFDASEWQQGFIAAFVGCNCLPALRWLLGRAK